MNEFCGSSRSHAGLERSCGPLRRYPVTGLLASFSRCVHSSAGFAKRGPASIASTSRPRAASSFATTAPPPPAPMTITSRIDRWAEAVVVALELGVPLGGPAVARDVPAHGPLGHRAGLRVV